jgi:hypothetical protein
MYFSNVYLLVIYKGVAMGAIQDTLPPEPIDVPTDDMSLPMSERHWKKAGEGHSLTSRVAKKSLETLVGD